MQDDKAWYRSRTVWGGLIAIAAALANLAGIEATVEEEGALADLAVAAAGALGAFVALAGHIAGRRRG